MSARTHEYSICFTKYGTPSHRQLNLVDGTPHMRQIFFIMCFRYDHMTQIYMMLVDCQEEKYYGPVGASEGALAAEVLQLQMMKIDLRSGDRQQNEFPGEIPEKCHGTVGQAEDMEIVRAAEGSFTELRFMQH